MLERTYVHYTCSDTKTHAPYRDAPPVTPCRPSSDSGESRYISPSPATAQHPAIVSDGHESRCKTQLPSSPHPRDERHRFTSSVHKAPASLDTVDSAASRHPTEFARQPVSHVRRGNQHLGRNHSGLAIALTRNQQRHCRGGEGLGALRRTQPRSPSQVS